MEVYRIGEEFSSETVFDLFVIGDNVQLKTVSFLKAPDRASPCKENKYCIIT